MSRNYESTSETELPGTKTHIIDYSRLVDAVQLSTARLLDMQGAMKAKSFSEILEGKNSEDREHIIWEVGGRFDDELVNFVTASLIGRQHRKVVILAEASEGVNGYLPWQSKLEEHIQHLQINGQFQDVELAVERYSTASTADIEILTEQAQELAA